MNNKNILQITGMISTKYGAIERYILHANEYCRQLGYRTFLQYETVPWSTSYIDDLDRSSAELIIRPVNIVDTMSRLRNVRIILSSTRPDIVHVHFVEPCVRIAIAMMSRLCGARRVICTVHNKPDWSRRHAGAITFNMYDYVLPVSNSVGETLKAGGVKTSKLHTHYLGIMGRRKRSSEERAAIRERFRIPENAILLATIAFDAPFKGLDILLEALSKIRKLRKDIYWMSVGVDNDSKLPEMASFLSISDSRHFSSTAIIIRAEMLPGSPQACIHASTHGKECNRCEIIDKMSLSLTIDKGYNP